MESNSKLPIIYKKIEPNYKKPERKSNLVPQENYDKVDSAVLDGVSICSDGVVYVENTSVAKLLQENESDAEYLIDNKIQEKHKQNNAGKPVIHSSALVGLLDERSQETRSASKQALQQYSRDHLINIADSDQAQNVRRQLDDFNHKEQKKLRLSRESETDEITGESLENGYAFHHSNQKSLHTNPRDALNPDKGVLVNDKTHKEIHKRKIRDEKALEEYKRELTNNK